MCALLAIVSRVHAIQDNGGPNTTHFVLIVERFLVSFSLLLIMKVLESLETSCDTCWSVNLQQRSKDSRNIEG